jgi:cephalosporin hydroxylase
MTLREAFADRLKRRSAIAAHLQMLSSLASECARVTEFGVNHGHSTIALLHGLANSASAEVRELESFDIADFRFEAPALPQNVRWRFLRRDTAKLARIEETDLLFIDSLHTCAHVHAELKHHARVTRYIVFHDTITFGSVGEDMQAPGLTHAIFDFLVRHNFEWRVRYHNPESHGLLVLERFYTPGRLR